MGINVSGNRKDVERGHLDKTHQEIQYKRNKYSIGIT